MTTAEFTSKKPTKRFQNQSSRFSRFSPLTQDIRLNPLTVQVFRTAPKRMGAFAGGPDGPGILHHVVSGFPKCKVVACFGERLHFDQGTVLEFELDRNLSDKQFFQLRDQFLARLKNFVPQKMPEYDLYAWLRIDVPHDHRNMLLSFTKLLVDEQVNLSSFRFDRLPFKKAVRLAMNGRLELRVGQDYMEFERKIRSLLPKGSFMPPLELSKDSPRFKQPGFFLDAGRFKAHRN
jgi:hypothetical protein